MIEADKHDNEVTRGAVEQCFTVKTNVVETWLYEPVKQVLHHHAVFLGKTCWQLNTNTAARK